MINYNTKYLKYKYKLIGGTFNEFKTIYENSNSDNIVFITESTGTVGLAIKTLLIKNKVFIIDLYKGVNNEELKLYYKINIDSIINNEYNKIINYLLKNIKNISFINLAEKINSALLNLFVENNIKIIHYSTFDVNTNYIQNELVSEHKKETATKETKLENRPTFNKHNSILKHDRRPTIITPPERGNKVENILNEFIIKLPKNIIESTEVIELTDSPFGKLISNVQNQIKIQINNIIKTPIKINKNLINYQITSQHIAKLTYDIITNNFPEKKIDFRECINFTELNIAKHYIDNYEQKDLYICTENVELKIPSPQINTSLLNSSKTSKLNDYIIKYIFEGLQKFVLKQVVISDLEGISINNYVKDLPKNYKLIINGDITDSTNIDNDITDKNFQKYNANNLYNYIYMSLHYDFIPDKIEFILGNRELMKPLILSGSTIKNPKLNPNITNFNNGIIKFDYNTFIEINKENIEWESQSDLYISFMQDPLAVKKLADINNISWYGRYLLLFEQYGCKLIEFIITEFQLKDSNNLTTELEKIPKNINEKDKMELEKKNYLAFVIICIFRSMLLLENSKIDTPKQKNHISIINLADEILNNLRTDLDTKHIKGILYKILTHENTKMINYIHDKYIISHGGITKNFLNLFIPSVKENSNLIKLEACIVNIIFKIYSIINTELEGDSNISEFTETTSIEFTKLEFIDIINECNNYFKVKLKNILDNQILNKENIISLFIIRLFGTETYNEISNKLFNVEKNNIYSPIGPGFLILTEENNYGFTITQNKNKKITMICGHKPVSFGNVFGIIKDRQISENQIKIIGIDASNSFTNKRYNDTNEQNKKYSYNRLIIMNDSILAESYIKLIDKQIQLIDEDNLKIELITSDNMYQNTTNTQTIDLNIPIVINEYYDDNFNIPINIMKFIDKKNEITLNGIYNGSFLYNKSTYEIFSYHNGIYNKMYKFIKKNIDNTGGYKYLKYKNKYLNLKYL